MFVRSFLTQCDYLWNNWVFNYEYYIISFITVECWFWFTWCRVHFKVTQILQARWKVGMHYQALDYNPPCVCSLHLCTTSNKSYIFYIFLGGGCSYVERIFTEVLLHCWKPHQLWTYSQLAWGNYINLYLDALPSLIDAWVKNPITHKSYSVQLSNIKIMTTREILLLSGMYVYFESFPLHDNYEVCIDIVFYRVSIDDFIYWFCVSSSSTIEEID